MEKIQDWMDGINDYCQATRDLKEIEKALLKPTLTDTSKFRLLYEWIEEISRDNPEVNIHRYRINDYYILIAALLYSPRVFTGGILERGQRDIIARILGISPSHVSNTLRKVCEWYNYYKDYQQSLEYLYLEVKERIRVHELN